MIIKVRWISEKYVDLTVCTSDATLELGVLNESERKQLADHLREVAEDLSPTETNND